jgi:hypothetical protein
MSAKAGQSDSQVTLALSTWELARLHLPAVTTVTLYAGVAPVPFLLQVRGT